MNLTAFRDPMVDAIAAAIENVLAHADTDIFPPPGDAEFLLGDRENAIQRIAAIHHDFEHCSTHSPPDVIRCLVPAGYLGQRLASQIPPLWNAYYLALVIACGPAIERARSASDQVFSYRFMAPEEDGGRIFDGTVGWAGFLDVTRQHAAKYTHCVVTDISDFYHRIHTVTVSKALQRAGVENSLRERLIKVLHLLEVDRFGLPVGGPASRLLAELTLVRTDSQLQHLNIPFTRFVDDIRLFAASEVDAHRQLVKFGEILSEDGFFLQKSKTRVYRSRDLIEEMDLVRATAFATADGGPPTADAASLFPHDPYSELRAQMDSHFLKFASRRDAASTVIFEFSKSRLHLSLAKNLLGVLHHLPYEQLNEVMPALFNLTAKPALTPIFAKLMEVTESTLTKLNASARHEVSTRLMAIAFGNEAVAVFDFHRALCIRLLAKMPGERQPSLAQAMTGLEKTCHCALVQREITAARQLVH
jgi:hypothetical protein